MTTDNWTQCVRADFFVCRDHVNSHGICWNGECRAQVHTAYIVHVTQSNTYKVRTEEKNHWTSFRSSWYEISFFEPLALSTHYTCLFICLWKDDRTNEECVTWKIEWIFFLILYEMLHYLSALWCVLERSLGYLLDFQVMSVRRKTVNFFAFSHCFAHVFDMFSNWNVNAESIWWHLIFLWNLTEKKNSFHSFMQSTVPTKTKTFNFMWKKTIFSRFVAKWKLKAA